MERIPKLKSAQKGDHVEENSPAAPAGTRTHDLSITSPADAKTIELHLLPVYDPVITDPNSVQIQ